MSNQVEIEPTEAINVGDRVRVEFWLMTNDLCGDVLYIPSQPGDSWIIRSEDRLFYVQHFTAISKELERRVVEPNKQDLEVAKAIVNKRAADDRDVYIANLALVGAIAHMRGEQREAYTSNLSKLQTLYNGIFTIQSTGDRRHPLKGKINYEAKDEFEKALVAASEPEGLEGLKP